MTSGGDTNNDVTDVCKQSTKSRKGYTRARLHVKPLKNKWLTEIPFGASAPEKIFECAILCRVCALIFRHIPQALDPKTREARIRQAALATLLICWATPLALTSICLN